MWSHGCRQPQKARVPLLCLPEQYPDIAGVFAVRREIAVPGIAGDEYCVSPAQLFGHGGRIVADDNSVRMYGDAD